MKFQLKHGPGVPAAAGVCNQRNRVGRRGTIDRGGVHDFHAGLRIVRLPAAAGAGRTGITVKVVALGTGQALDTARRGDADVVFVHDVDAEERFVAEGHGLARHPVMYNDFVLVGPAADPAGVRRSPDIVRALQAIRQGMFPFVSRGDRSGTHQAELRLWKAAGVEVDPAVDRWYRVSRAGHGAGTEHCSGQRRLCADRPRDLDQLPQQGRLRRAGGRGSAVVQPVQPHPGESGRSIRTPKPRWASSSSISCCRRRARRTSRHTSSRGSSCSIPMRDPRPIERSAWASRFVRVATASAHESRPLHSTNSHM